MLGPLHGARRLACASVRRIRERHPLFRLWTTMDAMLMQRVCAQAVQFLNLRPKDDLFTAGTVSPCAYVLVNGKMVPIGEPRARRCGPRWRKGW